MRRDERSWDERRWVEMRGMRRDERLWLGICRGSSILPQTVCRLGVLVPDWEWDEMRRNEMRWDEYRYGNEMSWDGVMREGMRWIRGVRSYDWGYILDQVFCQKRFIIQGIIWDEMRLYVMGLDGGIRGYVVGLSLSSQTVGRPRVFEPVWEWDEDVTAFPFFPRM